MSMMTFAAFVLWSYNIFQDFHKMVSGKRNMYILKSCNSKEPYSLQFYQVSSHLKSSAFANSDC